MDNDDCNSGDDESQEFIDVSSHVLVAIDCSKSMFEPSKTLNGLTGLQTALRALVNVHDDLILSKTTKNKIAVSFFHPDPKKTAIIDFDSPLTDTIAQLQKLAFSTADELNEYNRTPSKLKLSFSHFLIECRKKFNVAAKTDAKHLLYVTNHPDPCDGDASVKFQALLAFPDFKQSNIGFKLLPLVEEFDYGPLFGEVYSCIGEPEPKYYYNLEFLTSRIRDAVQFRSIHRKIQLYLNPQSNIFIPCLERNYCKLAKLQPNKTMTRDLQKKVIRTVDRNRIHFYRLNIQKRLHNEDITLSKKQKLELHNMDQVRLGLTVIHASTDRYSSIGENLKSSRLLKAKNKDKPEFVAFWEACAKNKLYLLCNLKYKEGGKVHAAELTPKIINFERQFLMINIPHSVHLSKPILEPVRVDHDESLGVLLDQLVEETTIEDYNLKNMRPYTYLRQAKYFKKELLGAGYKEVNSYPDLVNDKLYKGDIEDLCSQLNEMFPGKAGKRGKSRCAGAKRGRRK